ncbi:hypothetical protein KIW84_013372 [Lathyrus oleraceus]|uniref:Uncharacterized protein n=1 Tax=Pisum sativum TaxID=3888 RepID=A0A9D5BK48_PEA|nr:hypothetical protein KIW84_013372 [Pisum sativum]
MPQPSDAWKKVVDQLVLEKAQMKTYFESEIRCIQRKYAPMSYRLFFCASAKLTHRYNTRANQPKIMEHLKLENRELKDEIARLTAMMESILVAHNQSSPTPATPPQRIVIFEVATSTIPVAATQSGPIMSPGFPWGMPPNFMPEGFAPTFSSMTASSIFMYVPPPIVHTLPRVEDTIYPSEPSEGPYVYEKMDEMKDQFLELCKELKTLRGKYMFGKSVAELCLVPNVKIPMKFKVPDFEKQFDWCCSEMVMGLDSASVRTFNDFGEAFVKQYKYNMDMAPDRDHLRSMSQKDKETFKDAPNDFTEMVNMWMMLEKGVREGCLSKEEVSSNKKYGSGFSERKEGKTNSISVGRQRRPHVRRNPQPCQHQHQVSSLIPVFSGNSKNQSVPIQQQCQQQPQQRTNYNNNNNNNDQQQNFERKKVSFDAIPMSYAELYPSLVLKNLLQPRNPPQILEPLPWWYKPELRCAFHQGAPGHDIENCYPLKYKV